MPPIPFWARPRFVFLAILLYLVAHFAIRLTLGPALSVDNSEQALFAQHYAWAYSFRSPALLTWMLVTLGHVMPVGVVAISLLRYGLLATTYACVYLTARRLIGDPRLSALSLYSFAAIHIFAESSHRNLSHSISLAAMLAVSWYVFARLAAAPRLGWYLALGVAFALGMLAKWNFVIFAAALPLACLFDPAGRRVVLNWKTLAAIAVAAAIPTPAFFALLKMAPPAGQDIQSALAARGGPGLASVSEGTLKLLQTAFVYPMPLLPIVVIVLGLPFWRGLRARRSAGPDGAMRPGAYAVGPSIAAGLALLWVIVLVIGATELKVRYMHPMLLILPVWVFMVIEAGRPSARALNLFAIVMAALAVAITVERLLQPTGLTDCGLCTEWRPFRSLAADLTDAGYGGAGTIVADGETGGNMRILFPKARVVVPGFPLATWPAPSGEGQCLLLSWDNGDPNARAAILKHLESYLAGTLGGDPDSAHRDGTLSAPMLKPAEGALGLSYRLYDGPVGDCR